MLLGQLSMLSYRRFCKVENPDGRPIRMHGYAEVGIGRGTP